MKTMYEELIKRLRASCESCKLWDGYKCCLKGECSAQTRLQAADAIEDLDNRLNLHRQGKIRHWIPVTERLPEKDQAEEELVMARIKMQDAIKEEQRRG